MISKSLRAAAEGIGLTYVENNTADKTYIYGVYGGYLMTLYDSGNHKTVFINYSLEPAEEEDSVRLLELSEALKAVLSGLSVSDYTVERDGLSCTVNCQIDAFLELLDRLIAMLSEKGVRGVSHCSCCGNRIGKRYPKKLTVNRFNYLLCEHCALDKVESNAKEPSSRIAQLPKKTGLGVIGAVGGGILGILLYFLIYGFLFSLFKDSDFEIRYIFCLLGFVTAALVYVGFTMFSKRPCLSAYLSISSVTLLSVAVAQYIGSFVGYAKLQGFTLSQAMKVPSLWLIHLRSTLDISLTYDQSIIDLYHVAPLFYKLLGFSLLFALIGTIIFQLGLYEKGKVRTEPVEVETLRIAAPAEDAKN